MEFVEVIPYAVKVTEADKLIANLATEKKVKYNEIDTANAILRLKQQFGLANEDIGHRMGKSRQWVDNMIRLAKADDDIKEQVQEGTLKVTKAVRHIASKTKASDEMAGIIGTSKQNNGPNTYIPGDGPAGTNDALPTPEPEKELTEQEKVVADLKKAVLKMESLSMGLNDQAQQDFNYSFNWAMKQVDILNVFFSSSKNKNLNVSVGAINELIKNVNANQVSDGYHTIGELYEHRIELYIALCLMQPNVWRSKLHSDGTGWEGWFILGINKEKGQQITYHLPIEKWADTDFAEDLEQAPEYDGHTAEDVIARLKNL